MAEPTIENIISLILNDVGSNTSKEATNQAHTSKPTTPETKDHSLVNASKKQDDEEPEFTKRDKLYTMLLVQYISSNKRKATWNTVYKCIFFCVTVFILLALIVAPIIITIIIVQKDKPNLVVDLAALASSLIGVISAIIVLPEIIAKHLFPTNEDEQMIELVKNMQVNDSNIRDALKKIDKK